MIMWRRYAAIATALVGPSGPTWNSGPAVTGGRRSVLTSETAGTATASNFVRTAGRRLCSLRGEGPSLRATIPVDRTANACMRNPFHSSQAVWRLRRSRRKQHLK